MMNLASDLVLHSSTSLTDAMQIQPSMARKFFDGKPFDDWKKRMDAEIKIQVAIVERLNGVIQAFNHLGKVLVRRV